MAGQWGEGHPGSLDSCQMLSMACMGVSAVVPGQRAGEHSKLHCITQSGQM